MDMDSYLSSIDAYMHQQEQKEKEEQQKQEQQQQSLSHSSFQPQQQQPLPHSSFQPQQPQQQTFDFGNVPNQQELTDIWLNNLPQQPMYYNNNNVNPDLFLPHMFPGNFDMPPNNNPVYLGNESQTPLRIRKKPGRKPNPASPALRKAQNRAAQRAFRERKERHLKDLENTIKGLRDQRNAATKELNAVKKSLESYKVENWYLKGIVLTLQLVCYHSNISIPMHTPYLSETNLAEMSKTSPHAVEAYMNAYKKNNLHLKTSMTLEAKTQPTKLETPTYEYDDQMDCTVASDDFVKEGTPSSSHNPISEPAPMKQEQEPDWLSKIDESETDKIKSISPIPNLFDPKSKSLSSSLDAIHYIRLKFGLKATLANNDSITDISAARLKPTILQLAIPHDPRIDLIPTPHMRDRMIIFREQMDYDRCFALLLNEAVYHGGDPTMSESWELPASFFSEFWYLCIYYDVRRTNKWRRIKGLADVFPTPEQKSTGLKNSEIDSIWNEEALDEVVRGMPVLKPIIDNQQFEANDKEKPEYYYKQMMDIAAKSQTPFSSPTYEDMIELMKSL